MTRTSQPHRGPHAVFTRDELRRIRGLAQSGPPDCRPDKQALDADIVGKINAALGSDPKFRQPTK